MLDRRSSVYRGVTREAAERAYHVEARAAAADGYVPVAEDWSVALGQQVLTVTYEHDPEQAHAVVDTLDEVARTSPAARIGREEPPTRRSPSGRGWPPGWRGRSGRRVQAFNLIVFLIIVVVLYLVIQSWTH